MKYLFTKKQENQLRKEFAKIMGVEARKVVLAQAYTKDNEEEPFAWYEVGAYYEKGNERSEVFNLNVGKRKDERKALVVIVKDN